MYNTKFILSNNQDIYPGYLDKEQREILKKQFAGQKEFMRCGCKPQGKLHYKISEDLKIYPEHNNYEHDKFCSRYKSPSGATERQTAYYINEEDGEVTAYITFNPKVFDLANDSEKEKDNDVAEDEDQESLEEAVIEKEEGTAKQEEKKEPKLSLSGLIRSINVDSYSERILNNKQIVSRENFSKNVYYRMKKIKVSRMRKSIGELSLERDGVRFIYLPFFNFVKKEDKGLTKCYIQTVDANGEVYNNFVFPETLEKAIKEFVKNYGTMPGKNTMIAGFQYYKKGRGKNMYKVLGRIHLFQISDLGIYCRNLIERDTFNALCEITKGDENIKFWIPPEDESVGGIIQIKGVEKKILLLFRTKKDERIIFDSCLYEPLVINEGEGLTKEALYNVINK